MTGIERLAIIRPRGDNKNTTQYNDDDDEDIHDDDEDIHLKSKYNRNNIWLNIIEMFNIKHNGTFNLSLLRKIFIPIHFNE